MFVKFLMVFENVIQKSASGVITFTSCIYFVHLLLTTITFNRFSGRINKSFLSVNARGFTVLF